MKKTIAFILCLFLVLAACTAGAEETGSVMGRFSFGMTMDDAAALIGDLSAEGLLTHEFTEENKLTIQLKEAEYGVSGPYVLVFDEKGLKMITCVLVYDDDQSESVISYEKHSEKLRALLGEPGHTQLTGTEAEHRKYDEYTAPVKGFEMRDGRLMEVPQYEQWIIEREAGDNLLVHHYEARTHRGEGAWTCQDVLEILPQ